jgi:hypothetical protein
MSCAVFVARVSVNAYTLGVGNLKERVLLEETRRCTIILERM